MQITTLANEIANFSLFELKNNIEPIREMTRVEQNNVSEIIRNAALRILRQKREEPAETDHRGA